ncbi:hypothetical protein [Cerasicoccus frondis]|uniref:hypothetical protein n=1 Tax=Cerasicoccus frondis TaxID=490090 RepID=UPI002852A8F9|nr:hypothetical protein [Cerasicoccus frondis]
MYYKALITVEPAELSHIERRRPTKAFGKLAHFLTLGLSSPKEVRQTFTAISILQSLNLALQAIGVDNIVRLSKDATDFYYDYQGIPQDLRLCMDAFEREIDPQENELFNELSLVLEHHVPGMTFLVQVNILRSHEVGAHPIEIHINGFSNEFSAKNSSDAQLRESLAPIFAKQEIYDAYLCQQRGLFDQFTGAVVMALHQHMHVEATQQKTFRKMIRRGDGARAKSSNRLAPLSTEPAFHNYYGVQDAFTHAWVWSDLCHERKIFCSDLGVVDETGQDLRTIGPEGVIAGDQSRKRESSSSIYAGDAGNDAGSGTYFDNTTDSRRNEGGWFESLFGEDGFFSGDGDDGGSSCGGSCGGGCGGD